MNLKKIRTQKNMKLSELVRLSNIPRRTLEDIEKRDACTVANAIKIADALDVTLDELCRPTGDE